MCIMVKVTWDGCMAGDATASALTFEIFESAGLTASAFLFLDLLG